MKRSTVFGIQLICTSATGTLFGVLVCDDHMAGKGAFDDAAWLRAFATSLRERHRRRYGGSTTAAFLYERAADALDKMRADLVRKP